MSSSYHVAIPIWVLIKTILLVLILPMILRDLTRRAILRRGGEDLERHRPGEVAAFPAVCEAPPGAVRQLGRADLRVDEEAQQAPIASGS